MNEFCNACHGDSAPGASTNVQCRRLRRGPLHRWLAAAATASQPYVTNSTFNAPLNGGGFSDGRQQLGLGESALRPPTTTITSAHSMETHERSVGCRQRRQLSPLYLICTSCHDPHGSSNYRLLKDTVNGVTVGGYNSINSTGGTAPDRLGLLD